MSAICVAAAQTPDFREDIEAASDYAASTAAAAATAGAVLLAFPEGFLQGYVADPAAARRVALDLGSAAFAGLLARLPEQGPVLVVGLIEAADGALFNTAAVIAGNRLVGRYRKRHLLPGEARGFTAGREMPVFSAGALHFAVNICFDTNFADPARDAAEAGATLIVCCANNMLPHDAALAWKQRHNEVRAERCRETGCHLLSSDVTGERDGRIGWGPTALLRPDGSVAAQLPLGAPGLLLARVEQA
jgi:predicted amidohydrolase